MDLPEVLQWISGGRKTGTLYLERRSVQKRIVFRDGTIYTSLSNHPRESLGQFLVRERLVTEEQLFKALLRQEREGRLLGRLFVADGVLREEDLRRVLVRKAEETLYDLFLWPEGRFEFKDDELPTQDLVPIDLPVTGAIMEGIRRVDEWARIRQVFPTMGTTFRQPVPAPVAQGEVERHALALAAAGKTLAEMALEMRRSDFEAAAILFELHGRGAVLVDKAEREAGAEDTVGAIRDLLAAAERRLAEKRYDAALQAYEAVLSLDRLNQQAKKGLVAVVEARSRERALRAVPVEKVPFLTLDLLALTGERFDPHEGFVLSRINGEWDIRSILKLCPMAEEDTLLIFSRLIERKVVGLR